MVQLESSASYDGVDERDSGVSEVLRERLQGAVRGLVESLNASSKQFAEAAESFARDTVLLVDRIATRIERSAAETREMAGVAAQAASEARGLSEQLQAAVADGQEHVRSEVQELIAGVTSEIGEAVRVSSEAVTLARQAADEARSAADEAGLQAMEAKTAATQQQADAGTEKLLDRLEAEYRLLSQLVQNLQEKISSASLVPGPEEVSDTTYQGAGAAWKEQGGPAAPEATIPEESGWSEPGAMPAPDAPPGWSSPEATSERASWSASSESVDPPGSVEEIAPEVLSSQELPAGRLILTASPVPDFEKLLSLDGALGRLPLVRNVTLADYAREEVTFRVEIIAATTAGDFTRELGSATGDILAIKAASPGQLHLRISSAGV